MTEPITFTVWGKSEQAGSKSAWVPTDKQGNPFRRNGRIICNVTDSNAANAKAWMKQIAKAAGPAMNGRERIHTAVEVVVQFYFARPQSHFGTGRNAGKLKPSAPHHHIQSPDVDKLCRCLLDGMTGVVYQDDKQVVQLTATRCYTAEQPRADVRVVELPDPFASSEDGAMQQQELLPSTRPKAPF